MKAKVTPLKQSSAATLIGNPEPTFCYYPEYQTSEILDCVDLNAAGGLNLLDWEIDLLEPCLGRNEYGRWAAKSFDLLVPRQNGKTLGFAGARANYGMLILNESVIYTAHLQKTATETFELLSDFFTSGPMKKRVKVIKSALGREEIKLKSGARMKFLARTRNGGRGQHGDLLIFDEAQELTGSQQASFRSAISASPNPQTIYMGTPPEPDSLAKVFYNHRKRAWARQTKRSAWAEWAITSMDGDLSDPELWATVNPSLGYYLLPETIEGELEDLEIEEFAKERLCFWSMDEFGDAVINKADWDECLTLEPPIYRSGDKLAAGIKFTADGAKVALSVALKRGQRVYVECLEYAGMNRGVSWLADWITERRNKLAMVFVDGKSNTGSLVSKLQDAGYPEKGFKVMGSSDVVSASSMFSNAVTEHEVEHSEQPLLDESVCSATKRKIGNDGGWGFGNGRVECAPAESASFALMAVLTTKRNPNREQRIG